MTDPMEVDPSEPVAGPSSALPASTSATVRSGVAQAHPLPSAHFYSIEYPGYVQPASVPLAVDRLGGQAHIDSAFRRASARTEALLELRLRPGNPFAHPVPGDVVPTNNVLLKVVKRRRKKGRGEEPEGTVGEYTVEAVGVIPKTVRFRSMVDYQFQPDMSDPLAQLRSAMDNMDVEGILKYNVPPEQEDFVTEEPGAASIDPQLASADDPPGPKPKSNLRLFPPPLFSRQGIPQNYAYKANMASIVSTVVDEETGEEKTRLINRSRWQGFGPIAISFADKGVPEKPSTTVEARRNQADKKLLKRLEEFFRDRPVWTRAAILNQFAPYEVREIINSKILLPLVSYVFEDGPWRDTQIRLGYDPRQDVEARLYQRLYFRNTNHQIARPSVVGKRQEGRNDMVQTRTDPGREEEKRSHIFDGMTVTKETAAFQLCDIHDDMLKEMIEDEGDLRETCHERDGWYSAHAFERIKTVLRHKFFALLGGHIATREECEALLITQEGSNKLQPPPAQRLLRFGKHNMAKGALPPEDVAAHRLMATLEQKAKDFQSQRG
ncbi:RNA polymerase III transcription factor IIIC subunit-domain-containing protein [Amylocystis lapponica]|nr:RNA polymerase III transcription factor IIIC subunit-domain-containing protein [Amylocystis lapponica]